MNVRDTIDTQLNVLILFNPVVPKKHLSTDFVMLGNVIPSVQLQVLNQFNKKPKLLAMDTMNLWIDTTNNQLKNIIKKVDAIIINENEAKTLSGETNYINAAEKLRNLGARIVLIKRGEYGVSLFGEDFTFSAPAFPIDQVVDPTGAGDSFAGGFLGYLASSNDLSNEGFKRAIIVGSVMGSFCVEEFGVERTSGLSSQEIWTRIDSFIKLTQLSPEKELPNWNNLFAG